MSKFKAGDKAIALSVEKNGFKHYYNEGDLITCANVLSDTRFEFRRDSDGFPQTLSPDGFRAVSTNTIQLNQPYTSKNGHKWECIAIKDGIAFMSSGGDGDAYRFLLNGENLSQGGGLWDIEWGPVVEWVDTRGTWSEVGVCPQKHHVYSIRFPLIDGKPDFTQATVTPV